MIAVFVPLYKEVEKPHISLPALAGYLRKDQIPIKSIDANIEFYQYLLSAPGIRKLKRRADAVFREMDDPGKEMNLWEARIYADIAWFARSSCEELIVTAAQKQAVLHSDLFYNREYYASAMGFIQNVVRVAEAMTDLRYKRRIPENSCKSVNGILANYRESIYYDFYKEIILPRIAEEEASYVNILLDFHSQLIPGLILAAMIRETDTAEFITISGDLCPHLDWVWQTQKIKGMSGLLDGVIPSEYEEVVKNICEFLLETAEEEREEWEEPSISDVGGFSYFLGDTCFSKGWADLVDVPAWGPPDYNDLKLDGYFSPEIELPVFTSYGCYWKKCAFCNMYSRCDQYGEKDMERVVDEIVYLHVRFHTDHFCILDEELKPERMYELARCLLARDVKITWTAQTRFDKELTLEEYGTIRESGCIFLGFGLESGNNEVLRRMNTGFCAETAERILHKVHQCGIRTNVSVVTGFVGETESQWQDTVRFLIRNRDVIDSILPLCYTLTRNSIAERKWKDFGLSQIPDSDDPDSVQMMYPNYAEVRPDWKEREERLYDLYACPELMEPLLREKFPRGLYVSHGETDAPAQKKEYSLVKLSRDLPEIRKRLRYHFSGERGMQEDVLFPAGTYYYIADLKEDFWVKIGEKDAGILRGLLNGMDKWMLADMLGMSVEKASLMRMMCEKKYGKYLADLRIQEEDAGK